MCSNDTHKYVLSIVRIEYSCIPIGGCFQWQLLHLQTVGIQIAVDGHCSFIHRPCVNLTRGIQKMIA